MKTTTTTIRQPALKQFALHACVVTLLAASAAPAAQAESTPFDRAMAAQKAGSGAGTSAPTADAAPAAVPAPVPASAKAVVVTETAQAQPAPAPTPAPMKAKQRAAAAPAAPQYVVRAANQSWSGEPALSCRNINWKKGDIVRLQAQPYKQVHVTLPEAGMDVIMGDKELWALDWINNQLFIKPMSRSSEGRSTTISAIGQSGNAYEFVVDRVVDNIEISHCVYVNADAGVISRDSWSRPDRMADSNAMLTREVANLREQNSDLARQSRENIKSYRKKLNSLYSWTTGIFNRWSGGEVESVYDDGRFTYVRMKEDSQSLVSIMGDIDGKAQLLEYSYDAPSRTYQISGIFPKFALRNGEQSLAIERKGN